MEALINAQQGKLDEGLIFSGQYIEKIIDIKPVKEIFKEIIDAVKKAK